MTADSALQSGIGLIGVGRHGTRYLHHMLYDVTTAKLVAVCRRRVGEIPPSLPADIPRYDDYRNLIADPSVQAIVVVTPPSVCRDIALASIRAAKPLLIEKPLADTGESARAIVSAADRAGVLLMTAQTLRFDPALRLLKEQLHAMGPLQGGVMTLHIERHPNECSAPMHPGQRGAMLEIGVHLLDLVRFFCGEEVAEVQCEMSPPPAEGPEIEARVQIRTTSGIPCRLDIARVSSGRIGYAEWTAVNGWASVDWVQRRVALKSGDGEPKEWTIPPQPTIVAVLCAFLDAIRTRTAPPVTGLDGCRAVELADACYASAARNGTAIRII